MGGRRDSRRDVRSVTIIIRVKSEKGIGEMTPIGHEQKVALGYPGLLWNTPGHPGLLQANS